MSDADINEITEKIAAGSLSASDGQKQIMKILSKDKKTVHYKVAPKGGISFYGLQGRFPITIYKQALQSILELTATDPTFNETFQQFLDENEGSISLKER